MKKKLVVHTCCAVCMIYPKTLLEEYNTTYFFFNPNIYPVDEYNKRRDEFLKFVNKYSINYHIEENDKYVKEWNNITVDYKESKEKGERCKICFRFRLLKTFEYAKYTNADFFTTVMTVSPHKSSKDLEAIGQAISDDNTKFLFIDFKKNDGFKKTSILADSEGFYRQSYCGCQYSIRK